MAKVKSFDAGSSILIETEFKEATPFVDAYSYFDPAPVPTVTVKDSAGVEKVVAENMTKSEIGKYFYVVQTLEAWTAGYYTVVTKGGNGSYDDVTSTAQAFILT